MRSTHRGCTHRLRSPSVIAECPCQCHGQGSAFATCDIEGGCGHLHPPDRRCASGVTCVRREREETGDGSIRWVGARLTEAEGLCLPCVNRIGHTIGYLPADVVELTMLISADSAAAEEMVSSSRDLPVPIRLGVETLRAEIDFELQYWAEIVAAEVNMVWDAEKAERSRLAVRVQKAAGFLKLRVDTLVKLGPQERSAWDKDGQPIRDEWGDREVVECSGLDGALYLLDLHRRVYRVAGRTKLVHRLTPACPWCDQRTLVRHNGSDMVECESCGKQIDERHYNWFVIVTVAEEKRRQEAAA